MAVILAGNIFKYISLNETFGIFNKISLKYVLINNLATLAR